MAEPKWEKEYRLDNGAIVLFGPIEVAHETEGGKLKMTASLATKIIIPGMSCVIEP